MKIRNMSAYKFFLYRDRVRIFATLIDFAVIGMVYVTTNSLLIAGVINALLGLALFAFDKWCDSTELTGEEEDLVLDDCQENSKFWFIFEEFIFLLAAIVIGPLASVSKYCSIDLRRYVPQLILLTVNIWVLTWYVASMYLLILTGALWPEVAWSHLQIGVVAAALILLWGLYYSVRNDGSIRAWLKNNTFSTLSKTISVIRLVLVTVLIVPLVTLSFIVCTVNHITRVQKKEDYEP